jgi:SAM-dependent methyltransferase
MPAETGAAHGESRPVRVVQNEKVNERPNLDVPYVPTAPAVVDAMLKTTQVRKDDVVYDLGCGDGRIVITAAQRYGVRGVGVDIDPERIKESRENARTAGVTDRVQFFQQDLFKTDVRPATVMTLYLLPEINLRLRPKLFRELRPGTRIVSHDFNMDDWQADQVLQVQGPNREHTLYYWVVPANVAGTWQWGTGNQRATLKLSQQFQKVTGTVSINGKETPLTDVKLTGPALSFTVAGDALGQNAPVQFSGNADGHTLTGSMGEGASRRDWKATRDPATAPAPDHADSTKQPEQTQGTEQV